MNEKWRIRIIIHLLMVLRIVTLFSIGVVGSVTFFKFLCEGEYLKAILCFLVAAPCSFFSGGFIYKYKVFLDG